MANTNRKALVSFVSGILLWITLLYVRDLPQLLILPGIFAVVVLLAITAIWTGSRALKEIKKTDQKGKAMAIGGILLATIILIIPILILLLVVLGGGL